MRYFCNKIIRSELIYARFINVKRGKREEGEGIGA
jgi:hypothetical protein